MATNQRLSLDLCPLLTEEVVRRLTECGISSVRKLIGRTPENVALSSHLPLQQIESIQGWLLRRFGPRPLSGRSLLEDARDSMCIFPLGWSSMDVLLKGGIYTSELTELWGKAASGKTQVCLSLTSHVITMTTWTVAYVDGGGGFSATKLKNMLVAHGLTGATLSRAMEKVLVFRVFDAFDLITLLSSIKHSIASQADGYYSKLKLVLIDPITLFIAPFLGGRGPTTGRHNPGYSLMMEVAMAMRALSCEHHIAVVYCNNVVWGPSSSGGSSGGGAGVKAALGQLWAHTPSIRLHLSSIPLREHVRRVLVVSKSPRQVVGCQERFDIGDTGIIPHKTTGDTGIIPHKTTGDTGIIPHKTTDI